MSFSHAPAIWEAFPELAAGVVHVSGIHPDVDVEGAIAPLFATALERLSGSTESEFPEIQAWRRAFSRMGLKPTQYRCASESLLRRFRKDDDLPRIHPLIDLCNAVSLAFAIPIAVLDLDHIALPLTVRHATGEERYETFNGEIEHPEPGEVIFADANGAVHARRWCNRQSGSSAIRPTSTNVLIVAEAMHEGGEADIRRLVGTLERNLLGTWRTMPVCAYPNATDPVVTI